MTSTRKHLVLALVLSVAALTLSSCATLTAFGETERALCAAFRPITWSAQDTDQTIREVKAHNAVGASICGWAAE